MRAVVVLAAVSLFGACSSSPSTESSTTSSTAGPVTTTTSDTTTTTLGAIPVWAEADVPHRDPSRGGRDILFAVVEFHGKLVSAGRMGLQPAVLVSADGLTWTQVSDSDLEAPHGVIRDLVVGGPGLVAVGEAFTGESWAPRPAVWTSIDGLEWSRVPHEPDVFGFPEGGTIGTVAAGPGGLIAIGGEFFSGRTVWTSVDGLKWSRQPPNSELAAIDDLAVFRDSYVAVGADDEGAAVWLSSDGLEWSRATVPTDDGAEPRQGMQAVTVTDRALIAVGSAAGPDRGVPAVWVSEDGTEWRRVGAADLEASVPDLGYSQMWAVVTGEDEVIAVGWAWESEADNAAVWRSPDGLTWSRDTGAALGEDSGLFAVTPFLGGIAVVGYDSSDGPFAGAWYIGPSTATVPTTSTPAAPQPTIVP
jgi:hypothetical protein